MRGFLIALAVMMVQVNTTPTIPGVVECVITHFGDGINTINLDGLTSMYATLSHSEQRHLAHRDVPNAETFMEKYGTTRKLIMTFVKENVEDISERNKRTLLRKLDESWCDVRRLGFSLV